MRRWSKTLYGKTTRGAIRVRMSDVHIPCALIHTLGLIKHHAAIVNGQQRVIPKRYAGAIARAARDVARGKHDVQFPLDVYQTGSGTATHMNVNEVIATLASVLLERGRRRRPSREAASRRPLRGRSKKVIIHPNDHVNACQSSNDVMPTALQITCLLLLHDHLSPALEDLQDALKRKAKEFRLAIKSARTHLMEATPVRLGAEFHSYVTHLQRATRNVQRVQKELCILPLGGTAVGTGLNAHPAFARLVIARLKKETELPLREATDHIAAQSFPSAILSLSSTLREVALALGKIAQDIRMMAAIGEITLPKIHSGSSIMPGKVNPTIPEAMLQVTARVVGGDATVAHLCATLSNFELFTGLPLLAAEILSAIELLGSASCVFTEHCVKGMSACSDVITRQLACSPMLVTALAPELGYDAAAEIAEEAQRKGLTILEVASRRTTLPKAKLRRLLDPRRMV